MEERDKPLRAADRPHARGDAPDGTRERAQPQAEPERTGSTPLGPHPVGTAVGGVAGAVAAGAAVGSVAGPIGAAVGAAIGAAAGGMTGKLVADAVDPQMEDEFWRRNWSDRKYTDGGYTYDQDWGPAYRYGVTAYRQYPDRRFDELEPDLASGWTGVRGQSRLDWERARPASQEAWIRAHDLTTRNLPPDADGDNPSR